MEKGWIELKYVNTKAMLADLLTKPVPALTLQTLRAQILANLPNLKKRGGVNCPRWAKSLRSAQY